MAKGRALGWSAEHRTFCRQNRRLPRRELAALFNAHFGLERTVDQMKGFCTREGFSTGRCGCFQKGHEPANKGRKGWSAPGTEATRFKKGNKPHGTVPVGSYRMTTARQRWDNRNNKLYQVPPYWRLKVAEDQWIFLHKLIWSDTHGPIPKGHVVIFVDGDTTNCTVENLECICRGAHAILNAHLEISSAPAEVRRTIIAQAKLKMAISARRSGVLTGPRGERKSIEELAEDYGKKVSTVKIRMQRYGMTLHEALTRPLHQRNRKADAA